MTKGSVVHNTFVIEREYPVAPSRLYNAFANLESKKQWFGPPSDPETSNHTLDFRVGGREHDHGEVGDGIRYQFDVLYQDIVPNERIVYTYEMHINDDRISVSVATVELKPLAGATQLVITEQGAYLDGLDDPLQREQGTNELLDNLGKFLERGTA